MVADHFELMTVNLLPQSDHIDAVLNNFCRRIWIVQEFICFYTCIAFHMQVMHVNSKLSKCLAVQSSIHNIMTSSGMAEVAHSALTALQLSDFQESVS